MASLRTHLQWIPLPAPQSRRALGAFAPAHAGEVADRVCRSRWFDWQWKLQRSAAFLPLTESRRMIRAPKRP